MTAALAGTGAVLGAGLSAGLVAGAGAILRATAFAAAPGASVLTAAGLGAALGAVLTPLTALSLLRQVALGKALLFTMIGMSIGLSAGEIGSGQPALAAAAGVGGFAIIALLLRLTSGRRRPDPK